MRHLTRSPVRSLEFVPLASIIAVCAASSPLLASPFDADTLRTLAGIPVQIGGRHAPLDTAARSAVEEVVGRQRWRGLSAVELVLSWTITPQQWLDQPVIKVEHEPLKHAVGLDPSRRHFTYRELMACSSLATLLDAADASARSGRPLSALERQANDIGHRIVTMQRYMHGRGIAMVPGREVGRPWALCSDALEHPRGADIRSAWADTKAAFAARDDAGLKQASARLAALLATDAPADYPTPAVIAGELLYNRLHPFGWAWKLMTAAVVIGLIGIYVRRNAWDTLTGFATLAACGMFLYGFALRWQVAGRAPLSNMYESLVVFAGSVPLFALAFFILMRQRLVLVVASGLSAVGLVLADILPIESSITTLPPVLRNTVWLTVHVLTIMLGYGAAALSMGIGHVQLGFHTLAPKRVGQARELMRLNHYVMLVAVIFLTAGIVFGAIWANASWGRYWGWDPKETWSLITLLGYLGLLHARYTGWLRDFGSAVMSIVCFQLVLMTYYGVNYVLGTGLHSYGFGAGGLPWIATYLGFETLVITAALVRKRALDAAVGGRLPRVPTAATTTPC